MSGLESPEKTRAIYPRLSECQPSARRPHDHEDLVSPPLKVGDARKLRCGHAGGGNPSSKSSFEAFRDEPGGCAEQQVRAGLRPDSLRGILVREGVEKERRDPGDYWPLGGKVDGFTLPVLDTRTQDREGRKAQEPSHLSRRHRLSWVERSGRTCDPVSTVSKRGAERNVQNPF